MGENKINITIAYAADVTAAAQYFFDIEIPQGSNVKQTLEQASLAPWFPVLLEKVGVDTVSALMQWPMGVFSQTARWDTVLESGDRLEIYRPLKIDPKQARRLRANKNKPL